PLSSFDFFAFLWGIRLILRRVFRFFGGSCFLLGCVYFVPFENDRQNVSVFAGFKEVVNWIIRLYFAFIDVVCESLQCFQNSFLSIFAYKILIFGVALQSSQHA